MAERPIAAWAAPHRWQLLLPAVMHLSNHAQAALPMKGERI